MDNTGHSIPQAVCVLYTLAQEWRDVFIPSNILNHMPGWFGGNVYCDRKNDVVQTAFHSVNEKLLLVLFAGWRLLSTAFSDLAM